MTDWSERQPKSIHCLPHASLISKVVECQLLQPGTYVYFCIECEPSLFGTKLESGSRHSEIFVPLLWRYYVIIKADPPRLGSPWIDPKSLCTQLLRISSRSPHNKLAWWIYAIKAYQLFSGIKQFREKEIDIKLLNSKEIRDENQGNGHDFIVHLPSQITWLGWPTSTVFVYLCLHKESTRFCYLRLWNLHFGLWIQKSPFCVYTCMHFYCFSVNKRHKQREKSSFSVENVVV